MTQPLLARNTNIELYSSALNSLWSLYDRIVDPSFALSQDIDAWEIILRDPKAYQAVQQRLNDIAGPSWRVFPFNNSKEPGAILKAQIMEEMLRSMPHFADARKRLAQAVFRGQSVELITGERRFKSFAKTPAQNWLVPTGLKHIDHRRFMMRPVREQKADGTVRIRGELYIAPVPNFQGATINSREAYMGMWVKVQHPEHYVRIIYDDEESRLGFGRGIMDPMWFYCWVKTIVLKEGLQGLERWAQGVVVAKIDSSKPGSTEQTSQEIRDQALAELKKMRSRFIFAIDKDDDVNVLTGGGEGHQMVQSFLRYLDDCIMAVGTGAALHSGGSVGDAGTFASDKVGSGIQEGVVAFDRNKVDEDIGLDLLGLIDRNNRPQFAMIGQLLGIPDLADAPCPILKTVNAKRIDPDKAADRFSKIWSANPEIEIREDEFYEQIDCTPPRSGERVVRGLAPVAMGGGVPNPNDFPGADGGAAVDLETAAREIASRVAKIPAGSIKPLPAAPNLPAAAAPVDPELPPAQRSAGEPAAPKAPPPSVPEAPHQGPGYDPNRKRVEWFRDRAAGGVYLTDEQFAALMRNVEERSAAPAPALQPVHFHAQNSDDVQKALLKVNSEMVSEFKDGFNRIADKLMAIKPTVINQVQPTAVTIKNDVKPTPVVNNIKAGDVIVPAPVIHNNFAGGDVLVPAPVIHNNFSVPADGIKVESRVEVVLPPKTPTKHTFTRDKDTGAILGATSESK